MQSTYYLLYILYFQDYQESGQRSLLSHFSVKPNSTIQLVVLLFAIPSNFDHVVFDLFWGYPTSGRDYLDASCLMFNGTSYYGRCDYRCRHKYQAISHSGDLMDNVNKIGHHTINVSLLSLPSDITHLFFTLSAWNSPNISRYPNPSLRFYEQANPDKDLCKTTFQHAAYSQAVIMCSVSKGKYNRWEIFENGKLSAGNAKNYEPLKSTIQSLIRQGC